MKKYNEIEAKNNMKVDTGDGEEVSAPKEKEKMQKLVQVQPKKVKRGLLSRLVTGIIGPDGLPGIGAYVNDEIVKPAIKNIIFDAINSAARMALFRDGGGPFNNGRQSNYSRGRNEPYRPSTNYSNQYRGSSHEPPRERLVAPSRNGIEDYVIPDRYDAAHVLTTLTEYAERYGTVAVADYYETLGVPSKYTDNNYGWEYDSIRRATIMPARGGGYIIKFPPVEVISNG